MWIQGLTCAFYFQTIFQSPDLDKTEIESGSIISQEKVEKAREKEENNNKEDKQKTLEERTDDWKPERKNQVTLLSSSSEPENLHNQIKLSVDEELIEDNLDSLPRVLGYPLNAEGLGRLLQDISESQMDNSLEKDLTANGCAPLCSFCKVLLPYTSNRIDETQLDWTTRQQFLLLLLSFASNSSELCQSLCLNGNLPEWLLFDMGILPLNSDHARPAAGRAALVPIALQLFSEICYQTSNHAHTFHPVSARDITDFLLRIASRNCVAVADSAGDEAQSWNYSLILVLL